MPRRTSFTVQSVEKRLNAWREKDTDASMIRQAEALSVRQDMLTLLTFVRDNKIVGTQSTGNMPLKAVREVTARFVEPPQLDAKIGDRIYRLRTEEDVWPLYFLHILADVGGLIQTARARRWQLTAQGKRFLEAAPIVQAPFLLAVWWHKVNWLVAYPVSGMGEALPGFFSEVSLLLLRSLSAGITYPFREFADGLIHLTGITWGAQDSSFADKLLRTAIERMVIDRLEDFGALKCGYRKEPLGKRTISKLTTIQITPWGTALLNAMAVLSNQSWR